MIKFGKFCEPNARCDAGSGPIEDADYATNPIGPKAFTQKPVPHALLSSSLQVNHHLDGDAAGSWMNSPSKRIVTSLPT